MLNLIVGVILGAMIGTVCTCLMVAASDAEEFDDLYQGDDKDGSTED